MSSLKLTALNLIPLVVLAWADNHGLDSHEVARMAGIDRSGLSDPDGRVPVNQVWDLWQVLIEKSQDIDLPYTRPASIAEHKRLFRTQLEFDRPAATLVFRKEDLDRPVKSGDGTLSHYLDQLADEVLGSLSKGATFADRVRSAIWTDLSTGKTSVQRIAKRLGISPRSLQRNLAEEGTTFSTELDALREEMARTLLRDRRHAVCEVAFLLGYSEPSSFFRAL